MRQTRFVILSWVVLWTAAAASAQTSAVTALKIRHKLFDPEARQLSYELWNDSRQTITAWRLSLARSDPHGHAANSVLDQDVSDQVSSLAGGTAAGPVPGPLPPGGTRSDRWRLGLGEEDEGPSALSLAVVAVVFEDLSWQGDPRAAAAILEARAMRVREIGRVVEVLESESLRPRSRQLWSSTLSERAARLRGEGKQTEIDEDLRPEVAAQLSVTRMELADWLEHASREVLLAPNPGDSLRLLTGDLRRRYESGLQSIPEPSPSADGGSQPQGGGR